ncbi:MAG: hypothetical protein COV29_00325 [Candidatus Yanofskybacteria bacterium CG10_big_fil_rev_8_21_14_0_10_36_16]|uniref:Uncharacterized protein n=1 Tax=Candidatus Yanofskybacteria bacterium CG10_big_fil_rev_8_21_14_0_10_36_16 TaxID=1975096 RepID=A0A2J0QBF4_9BACT|nr:MAG: hypothetical protein COV29_00325 [Candidatus Yanofskybacteria bacterium CG10_big_fil_rev_8_21_14_0_10_36_16]
MQFKLPKDNEKYKWTNHVKDKMVYYGISESLIKRVVRHPHRTEEGVATGTTAVMQKATSKTPQEIWVMYQENKNLKRKIQNEIPLTNKKTIISAWRYPGISPVGKAIPIPDEILAELENIWE